MYSYCWLLWVTGIRGFLCSGLDMEVSFLKFTACVNALILLCCGIGIICKILLMCVMCCFYAVGRM